MTGSTNWRFFWPIVKDKGCRDDPLRRLIYVRDVTESLAIENNGIAKEPPLLVCLPDIWRRTFAIAPVIAISATVILSLIGIWLQYEMIAANRLASRITDPKARSITWINACACGSGEVLSRRPRRDGRLLLSPLRNLHVWHQTLSSHQIFLA